jgi:NAD(P)-dependent dehydrogenase (short-subunit alcohol dehydrogenase family)
MARVWFITGASRGLGRSIASAALRSGDNVIATARDPSTLSSLVEQYGADRVLATALDVTDPAQAASAVEQGHARFGRIDVLVNNAGYAETTALEDMTVDNFRRQIDANFLGTVWTTKALVPIMRRQGAGRILQVSSVGARVGTPGLSGYQSAKWAVSGFSAVLAQELAPFGVKITSLEPGGMKTDWAGSSMERGAMSEPYRQTVGAFEELRKTFELHWADPDKVADAIIAISKVDDPPLRLLLGPDTVQWAKAATQALVDSDAKWENFSKNLGQ